jgi:putative GTP pyrophosphokinase
MAEFPSGSKTRLNAAGDRVRDGSATLDDMLKIEVWRAAHRHVLNTFQAILRNRTSGTKTIVAQRHKRKKTIFDKLLRLPKMQLSRMDDVAGCRLIFTSLKSLNAFRHSLHKAGFQHKLRNQKDKYDYVASPKPTGYRGIHDIYEYDVRSAYGEKFNGLLIELQYRTVFQHAWATSVEVIGLITEAQPKFQKGDKRYEFAMSLASEIIARSFESLNSCHPNMTNGQLVEEFKIIDGELNLLGRLQGLNAVSAFVLKEKNVILNFMDDGKLAAESFRDATDAVARLFELEKLFPNSDVVLVRADSTENVRVAFRNYFSDASEFIKYVRQGCLRLMEDPTGKLG